MKSNSKTFLTFNFGCRVNAAETNQFSQLLVKNGYQLSTTQNPPSIILVNTCSVTKKGEYESIHQIKKLSSQYPHSVIIATGCADLKKVASLKNVTLLPNQDKEQLLSDLHCLYARKIGDKFSHTHRYLLKIQSGCTQFCTYCTVPFQRPYLWSLPIKTAVQTVKQALKDGYREIIITGVNIDQYQYGLSRLIFSLLDNTSVPLISFGSVPINCIDNNFIKLYQLYPDRLSHFLHIPIQSASDRLLKLMNRPYDSKKIISTFKKLNLKIKKMSLGTDIIVGFPTETKTDFQATYNLCQSVGFSKIHVFKYSPRPHTSAKTLFLDSPKIKKEVLKLRSSQIRKL